MHDIKIHEVRKDDLELLDQALRKLSKALGDTHRANAEDLKRAIFGANPIIWALIARRKDQLCGAVVFSPVYSTVKGAAGLYVSDLWVARGARGEGLGQRLLASAAQRADRLWGADFLKLTVYDTSPDAHRFYTRLGFSPQQGDSTMVLNDSGLKDLTEGLKKQV